jgi:hypothetical protein
VFGSVVDGGGDGGQEWAGVEEGQKGGIENRERGYS